MSLFKFYLSNIKISCNIFNSWSTKKSAELPHLTEQNFHPWFPQIKTKFALKVAMFVLHKKLYDKFKCFYQFSVTQKLLLFVFNFSKALLIFSLWKCESYTCKSKSLRFLNLSFGVFVVSTNNQPNCR